jgi:Transketolase
VNGIVLHGPTRAFGGTFLIFSDYMRPAVRLAALMKVPSIFVWTHDSVALGEDGPTHQPVEQLWSLRAIPGLDVVRPADAHETAWAWKTMLEKKDGPAGIALTRQGVPVLDRSDKLASAEHTVKGGYVLSEASSEPELLLIATGSEVSLALDAQSTLEAEGTPTRVVSMPCIEWFEAQDQTYRDSVLPPGVRARVSVEAGVSLGWKGYVGDHGRSVSIERFGASADYKTLFQNFGITSERVVDAAKDSLRAAKGAS